MNITPSLEKLKELAAEGRYTVAPVSTELLSDFTTPIEALRPEERFGPLLFAGVRQGG